MPAKQSMQLYTKADLARHFQLPESTIRYYCARFAPYLSCEGEGRHKRYHAPCLDVLAFIREQLPLVRTSSAVNKLLAERSPVREIRKTHPQKRAEATIPSHFERCQLPENPICLRAPTQPATRSALASIPDAAVMALQLLERQGTALERIASALTSLVEQGQEQQNLRERANITDSELENLRKETRTLRLLLDSSEKTQQQDFDQLRTWLGKVIREKK